MREGDLRIDEDDPENNWVLSSQPYSEFTCDAGGVDGTLRVTLAVNRVTTTGRDLHPDRVITGQIHVPDDALRDCITVNHQAIPTARFTWQLKSVDKEAEKITSR